jgi:NitT/TauT family transport system substrate-binding protein
MSSLVIRIKDSQNLQYYPPFSNLPLRVAEDEGLFAAEGLEVIYVRQDEHWRERPAGEVEVEQVDAFSRHYLFEKSQSDIVAACEWGNLRRASESKRDSKALSRLENPGNQALIVAPDSKFTHPRLLVDQPVAVGFHSGSHYTALELLEGFMPRSQIKLVNKTHLDGWNAVLSGEVAAVTLMEPWTTLARKRGMLVLAEAVSHGVELGAASVDPDAYRAYVRAIREAVKRLNADTASYIRTYINFILNGLPEELRSELSFEDFYVGKFRWGGPKPYPEADFLKTYQWLTERDLIDSGSSYDRLVNAELALV